MNKKKIIIWIIAIVFIGIAGYRIYDTFFKAEEIIEKQNIVKVEVVEERDIVTSSPISAKIEPKEQVAIIPMAQGQITSVNVKLGDKVKKGQVLFTIDSTQAKTVMNKAKEGYLSAKSTFERVNRLYQEGAISKQEFENAQTQKVIANENYISSSDAYSNCIVTSTIDGYVTSLNVSVGNMAGGKTPAVTVADVSSLNANVSVSEFIIGKIKQGDTVDLKIATLGDKVYKGEIEAVSPAPALDGVTYPVKIKVTDESGDIKAGMFAEISIKSVEEKKAVTVPTSSVILKKGETKVAIVDDEDIVKLRAVETGIDTDKYIEIKSGLKAGERVIVKGQEYVVEGEKVLVEQ